MAVNRFDLRVYKNILMYVRLDIADDLFLRDHKLYREQNPRKFKYMLKLAKLHSKLADKTDNVRIVYNRVMNKVLAGPYRLKIPFLNRRDYQEHDNLIQASMFQILQDFVELELPYEVNEEMLERYGIKKIKRGQRYPELAEEWLASLYSSADKEIHTLYKWWIEVGRPRYTNYDGIEKEVDIVYADWAKSERFAIEANHDDFARAEEQEMMVRLLNVRSRLWT